MAFAPLWFRPRCVDTGRRGEHSENTRRSHAHRNVRADWVGKTITYDGGQFVLEGKGNIRAAGVMEYDRQSCASPFPRLNRAPANALSTSETESGWCSLNVRSASILAVPLRLLTRGRGLRQKVVHECRTGHQHEPRIGLVQVRLLEQRVPNPICIARIPVKLDERRLESGV